MALSQDLTAAVCARRLAVQRAASARLREMSGRYFEDCSDTRPMWFGFEISA